MLECVPPAIRQIPCGPTVPLASGRNNGLKSEHVSKPVCIRPDVVILSTTSFPVALSAVAKRKTGDASRVMSAIILRMGILGKGVILAQRLRVRGITPASRIYALAATGITIGLAALSLAVIGVLILVEAAERAFPLLHLDSCPRREK